MTQKCHRVHSEVKQTLDVAKEARFTLDWKEVETFYTTPLGAHDKNGIWDKHGGLSWSKEEAFDTVDWRALDATLHNRPQMYKQ